MRGKIADIYREIDQDFNHSILSSIVVGLAAGAGVFVASEVATAIFENTVAIFLLVVLGSVIYSIVTYYILIKIGM
ncbi:hypothetical protein [Haloferax larsenii]|uniref:hypothetical protein n=1 Tax=Haloferax larsenii TaxID=302484 RepID=UPI0011144512|nr:hypothetical protein [Haloferax larsenii]